MEEPLISVIVPVYKVEPYLDKCISSIANQTFWWTMDRLITALPCVMLGRKKIAVFG